MATPQPGRFSPTKLDANRPVSALGSVLDAIDKLAGQCAAAGDQRAALILQNTAVLLQTALPAQERTRELAA